jgi:hypothetical protein
MTDRGRPEADHRPKGEDRRRVTMDQPVGAIKATLGGYFWVEKLVRKLAHLTWAVVYSGKEPMVGPSRGRVERVKKRAPYAIVRTTPPSTRKEVPVVADACSEQT